CERFVQEFPGGAEVETTVLFADVRGSTRLAERMSPGEFSRLINRFYNAATRVLFNSHAMVEKLIGDAATAFYTAGHAGPDHPRVAVEAARQILQATGHGSPDGPWISIGIGVHTGVAYIGAVSTDIGAADVVVMGDTPNIGARLAGLAGPGEIYVSETTALKAGINPAGAEIRQHALKGRNEPVQVWVLSLTLSSRPA
ncbi:MAG TPA: adenylate/guanylate cyclase domain-containing protein, partial [Anaerolineaceae bacterium]|nr:adenylate/guanylate cyclase domain-containing protein [Anaerolineaceae bacterium]